MFKNSLLAGFLLCATAASAQPTVDDILSIGQVGSFQWSRDGASLAYSSNLAEDWDVYVVRAAGGTARRLTNEGADEIAPAWSPDGSLVAYLSDREGDLAYNLFIIPSAGGPARQLTTRGEVVDDPGSRHDMFPNALESTLRWSPDGKRIAFVTLDGIRSVISVIDVSGGPIRPLITSTGNDRDPRWSLDGSKIAFVSTRAGNSDIWVANADGSAPQRVTSDAAAEQSPSWSPDGRQLAYATEKGGDWNIETIPVAGGSSRRLTTNTLDEIEPAWSPDSSRIAFVTMRGVQRDLMAVNLADGRIQTLVDTRGIRAAGQWSPDGKTLAFVGASGSTTRDLWVVPGTGGSSRQLTSSMGRIRPGQLSEPELVTIDGFDGLKIDVLVYKPQGFDPAKKYPAIMNIHGGPNTGHWIYQVQPWQQFIIQPGYVMICPNPRGSGGYGRTFAEMSRARWGEDDFRDLLASDDYLRRLPYVDAAKVGIWGGSYGGFLSYQLVTREPARFRASVIRAGLENMVLQYKSGPSFARSATGWLGGSLEQKPDYYQGISAIHKVADVKAPMLIYHGTPDKSVHISQSHEWVAAMKKLGKHVEFYEFPDDDHAISKKATWRALLPKVAAFYRRFVAEGGAR